MLFICHFLTIKHNCGILTSKIDVWYLYALIMCNANQIEEAAWVNEFVLIVYFEGRSCVLIVCLEGKRGACQNELGMLGNDHAASQGQKL